MKIRVPDHIASLSPYVPGKPIDELERELGISDSVKLASNENPLGVSPKAVEAICNQAINLNRYPDGNAFALKKELSASLCVEPDEIIFGNGSDELIDLIVRTFLLPGDEVLTADPSFMIYWLSARASGHSVSYVPLKNFMVDLDGLLSAVGPRTKVIFLNNPNNPTGSVVFPGELDRFIRALPDDVILVLDEAYMEFIEPGSTISGLEFLDYNKNIIVLRTFSKAYGLAGIRIGYGVSSKEIIDYINRVRLPFNTNMMAQSAALAVLKDKEFVDKTINLIWNQKKMLYQELERMGVEYVPTQANFFLIKTPVKGNIIYEKLLFSGVIVRPMDSYDFPDYIRLTIGSVIENEKFLMEFAKILQGFKSG